jgi:phosphate-selective porin OprO/OprP
MIIAAALFLMLFTVIAFGETNVADGKTEWDDGVLHFKSNDGNFQTRFDIRMYLNGAWFFENKNELSNGTHLRKGRFSMKTRMWDVWQAEWDIDIAEGVVEIKDMYFSFLGFSHSHIKVGHFKAPLGLEELTSSRYQTFAERAYPMIAFEIDRRAGIEYSRWGDHWNFRGMVFGQTFDVEKNKTKDETGGGVAGRLVAAPQFGKNLLLHLGIAGAFENPYDENDVMEFKSEPETKIGDMEILDTGNIFNVDYATKIGLEGVIQYKSLLLQGEYIRTNLKRLNALENVLFDGSYAFASWMITGEKPSWDKTQGEFNPIIPKNMKRGAWELVARLSYLNLSDTNAGILGGRALNYTGGVTWHANPNIKILLNCTYVNNSENATGNNFVGNDDFSFIQTMAMVFF